MSQSHSQDGRPSGADRYRVLLEASRTLGATLSPAQLHEAIFRETVAVVPATGFYLALHDQSRDLSRVVYCAEGGTGQHLDVPYRGSDSEVITSQRASLITDGLSDGSLMSLGEDGTEPTRSAVTAPLLHDGRVLGAISAQSHEPDAFTQDDLEMLEGIAGVAAVAIYNSMQFAELDRRRKEAEQLEEIGRALTSKLDPDQVLGRVIAAVSEVLDVDGAAVWLRDPKRPTVCGVADSGGDIALPVGLEWDISGEMQKILVDEHGPIVFDNLAASDALPEQVAAHLTGGSAVGVPLILGGQVAGILTAGSRQPRRFGKEEIAVLQRLASQASVALGNARTRTCTHSRSPTR
ncbi:MAG: GAF domain-containing protein [Gemmatimonadetes bacterium]|nr:GAF domain-containing protein [Gemmatimonadota bacterium]MDA1102240.1 GAF domain-containing protein [Gemmatimonadota bacterium]